MIKIISLALNTVTFFSSDRQISPWLVDEINYTWCNCESSHLKFHFHSINEKSENDVRASLSANIIKAHDSQFNCAIMIMPSCVSLYYFLI